MDKQQMLRHIAELNAEIDYAEGQIRRWQSVLQETQERKADFALQVDALFARPDSSPSQFRS